MMLLALTALALADVVSDPPEDCPPGSVGSTSHRGTRCAPLLCNDATCNDDLTCQNLSLCVVSSTFTVDTADPHEITELDVVGLCAEDGSCVEGTCTAQEVCAEEGAGESKLCGCASGAGAPSALLTLGAFAALRRRNAMKDRTSAR